MQYPTIDLSDAAQAYGLHHVPPVVFDFDAEDDALYIAGFFDEDWTIHAGASLLSPRILDPYNQSRFEAAGVGALSQDDAARFIVAHELWHAVQYERDADAVRRINARERLAELFGIDPSDAHDASPVERSADRHAASVYRLVRIDGKAG